MPNNTNSSRGIAMSQIASLIVLAALVVVIGLMSWQVMSVFLLPLFLAGMSAVLLKPLHVWLTKKCRNRTRLAAMLTTLVLTLGVLVPSIGLGLLAASEMVTVTQNLDRDDLAQKIGALQNRWSLGPPPTDVMQALDRSARTLDQLIEAAQARHGGAETQKLIAQLNADSKLIETTLHLTPNVAPFPVPPTATAGDVQAAGPTAPAAVTASAAPTKLPPQQLIAAWATWKGILAEPKPAPDDIETWFMAWDRGRQALARFRNELLGGPIAAWFKQNVNVDPDLLGNFVTRVRTAAGPFALGTTQFIASFVFQFTIGLIVMLTGVYYFLADGRDMIASVMRLTPLDRGYLEQLVEEFANLTRAVVLSMLLAAVVQGVLAGFGYWFVGVGAVFLLTVLTTLFAMLPLVGATGVWGVVALWLWLYDGRAGAAIVLAIYCTIVVSVADNLVKPMVLHGRSNLHPLAALLSVIGGAQVLGPIGVFVGPMVVALLHTVLVMLRKELYALEKT